MPIGLVLAAVAVGLLVAFWDKIREWLMGAISNLVESVFGFAGRLMFDKAIVAVDKVVVGARNAIRKVASVIFGTEKKTYMIQELDDPGVYTLEELTEIDKQGTLVQTFVEG